MAEKPKVPGAGYPPPVPPQGAPLYEALGPVFVNGRLYQRGEQFRSAAKPGRLWREIEAARPAPAPSSGKRGGRPAAPAAPVQEDKSDGDQPAREADQSPI